MQLNKSAPLCVEPTRTIRIKSLHTGFLHEVSRASPMCVTSVDLLLITHPPFAHNSRRRPKSTRCSALKCHRLSFTVMPAPSFIVPVILISLRDSSKSNSRGPEPQAPSMIPLSHGSWTAQGKVLLSCVSLHAYTVCGSASMHSHVTTVPARKHTFVHTHCTRRCTDAEYVHSKNKD